MGDSVTLAEAARQLSISTRTARRWVRSGALPADLEPGRHGPQYLVPAEAVEALRDERARTRAAQATALHVADVEPLSEALRDAWRELTRTQQELWRASRELIQTAAEMRRLREELAETRQ